VATRPQKRRRVRKVRARIGNRPPLPYLDVSTTYNAAEKTIYVNVLNRSKDKDLATRIDNQEGALQGEIGV